MMKVSKWAYTLCLSLFVLISSTDGLAAGVSSPLAADVVPTLAPKSSSDNSAAVKTTTLNLSEYCEKSLAPFAGPYDKTSIKAACEKVQTLPECQSVNGAPLFHYNKTGDSKKAAKILVISLIHGDETPAGSVGRFWMERLEKIVPRNHWRVIPILNPDGLAEKTRTNANKIDLNRNFPTADWNEKALNYWQKDTKSNPRRYPGVSAASEPELKCVLQHLDDFKPDFIVSIHTPLKVLDYDGPKVKPPAFNYLPWKSLGTYPGSLGRYMWHERKVPVLTMELKEDLPQSQDPWVKLQDIIGVLVGLETMSEKERAKVKSQ